jgi:hypothetical protein
MRKRIFAGFTMQPKLVKLGADFKPTTLNRWLRLLFPWLELIVFIGKNSDLDRFKNKSASPSGEFTFLMCGGGSLVAERKAVALEARVRFSPIALFTSRVDYRHIF